MPLNKETKPNQVNAIGTNYIRTKIDYSLLNNKHRLIGDKDETVHQILSKCIKVAKRSSRWEG